VPSQHYDRIEELADRARRERAQFEPSADPPDEERAMELLREGVGPLATVYLEGRTGGDFAAFSESEWDLLHRALDDWLEMYAACYGEELQRGFQIRTLAELLIETHNVCDAAVMLTNVPQRDGA
jgi:hypothetical protein